MKEINVPIPTSRITDKCPGNSESLEFSGLFDRQWNHSRKQTEAAPLVPINTSACGMSKLTVEVTLMSRRGGGGGGGGGGEGGGGGGGEEEGGGKRRRERRQAHAPFSNLVKTSSSRSRASIVLTEHISVPQGDETIVVRSCGMRQTTHAGAIPTPKERTVLDSCGEPFRMTIVMDTFNPIARKALKGTPVKSCLYLSYADDNVKEKYIG
uniref:Uncharacterized protein n=1 Tax=Vespula pensylvanica TaxID=30213 RepID=A0A834NKH0_VESPE|nr:hypothetical protein H0235_013400 [Vespula pensylvanica]